MFLGWKGGGRGGNKGEGGAGDGKRKINMDGMRERVGGS